MTTADIAHLRIKLDDETIAREGGGDRTLSYVERIQGGLSAACSLPSGAPRRDHIRPGLRVIGSSGGFHCLPDRRRGGDIDRALGATARRLLESIPPRSDRATPECRN